MAWIPKKELDAAVNAMEALAASLTTHTRYKSRIKHPAQEYNRDKWEAVICAMIAAAGATCDAVLPEHTYLMHEAPDHG